MIYMGDIVGDIDAKTPSLPRFFFTKNKPNIVREAW